MIESSNQQLNKQVKSIPKSHQESIRSLERLSWSSNQSSFKKIKSFIQINSNENSRKSADLYEKMLLEAMNYNLDLGKEQRLSNNGSQKSKRLTMFDLNMDLQDQNDRSESLSKFTYSGVNHVCLCLLDCKQTYCPCILYRYQECQQNYCCKNCIQIKKYMMSNLKTINEKLNKSYSIATHIITSQAIEEQIPKISCTCKKSRCNKKHCTCYSAGMKCSQDCNCIDCQNQIISKQMLDEKQIFIDEEMNKLQMPQNMQFQPFEFRYSYDDQYLQHHQ